MIGGGARQSRGRRVEHLDRNGGCCIVGVLDGRLRCGGPRLEPVAAEVEEAPVGPVAAREEEDEQQERAVDARPVEEVCAHEEEEDEGRRGVGRDEEEGEPAVRRELACRAETLTEEAERGVMLAYLRKQNILTGSAPLWLVWGGEEKAIWYGVREGCQG